MSLVNRVSQAQCDKAKIRLSLDCKTQLRDPKLNLGTSTRVFVWLLFNISAVHAESHQHGLSHRLQQFDDFLFWLLHGNLDKNGSRRGPSVSSEGFESAWGLSEEQPGERFPPEWVQ